MAGLAILFILALFYHRSLIPFFCRSDRRHSRVQLFLLMSGTLLLFTAISLAFELEVLLGAIVAGIVFKRFLRSADSVEVGMGIIRPVAYGLLGPVFFFEIGYSIGLGNVTSTLLLTLLLLVSNFTAKILSAFMLSIGLNLSSREALMIGLGLSTKFSMGIIPVQIFYAGGLIDQDLFSSFVAVSAITTMIVPVTLSWLINRWKTSLQVAA